jgi:hypothetical protein
MEAAHLLTSKLNETTVTIGDHSKTEHWYLSKDNSKGRFSLRIVAKYLQKIHSRKIVSIIKENKFE